MSDFFKDTIVAQSTPVGEGAIGILRLSGPSSKAILQKIFRGKADPDSFESHRLYVGEIVDPRTGEALDQVMAVWMRAPNSFTGEEMVEIHAHGGAFWLCELLKKLTGEGARLAEPGEFTHRAFLNGKIDLAQAEAVADLIHAKNEWAAKNALKQLGGQLSRTIHQMRETLLELCAQIEAGFDFSEEDIRFVQRKEVLERLGRVEGEVTCLLDSFETGQIYKDGLTVALIGRPNAGKSSLLNAILKEDKAIIHEEPGTTRDVVSGERKLNGISVTFFDTAGIREAANSVEQEGIRRSKMVLEKADCCLLLVDSSRPLNSEDLQLLQTIQTKPHLLLYTKTDLSPVWKKEDYSPDLNSWVELSALREEGLNTLFKALEDLIFVKKLRKDHGFVLNNVRHQQSLVQVRIKLKNVQILFERNELEEECLAEDLREMASLLEGITGAVDSEAVLDKIFSTFCIGK